MIGLIAKLFGGNKSEKDIKTILPLVKQVNEEYARLQDVSIDELRAESQNFRRQIKEYLVEIDGEIRQKQAEADEPDTDVQQRDLLYAEVDKLKKDRDKKTEEVLKEILPKAFAVMKETAHRFKENEELIATATDLDRQLAVKKNYIRIEPGKNGESDKAIYKNSWEAAGGRITWNMLH